MKLPARTAGLPGEEVSFVLCPPWAGLIDLTPRGTYRLTFLLKTGSRPGIKQRD